MITTDPGVAATRRRARPVLLAVLLVASWLGASADAVAGVCGNQVVEAGEQCDGNSACCSASCQFINGVCGAQVTGINLVATANGVAVSWTNPVAAGFTRVEVFRVTDGTMLTSPSQAPQLRVYSGTATSFVDTAAPGTGVLTYHAFAIYSGGWAAAASASISRDDLDGDGMSNACEIKWGLDPQSPADAALDPDADGLSNVAECAHGSNPNAADTDGDGLKDGQEVSLGTDPTRQDTDGDGMSDSFELGMGLDPNNGHDFAIGNFSYSQNYRIGAYVVDSGKWEAGGYVSAPDAKKVITASQAQMTGVGSMGSSSQFGWAGYLYTIEEFIAPNYPPSCNAGLDQTVRLPGTAFLSGAASDPNGDPLSFSWSFVYTPPTSQLTAESIAGATTATPSFTPDVFGYYTLELSVTDVLGVSAAPCYVVVTAVEDDLFFFTGPFMAFSAEHKLITATASAAGGFPEAAVSGSFKMGFVAADAGPSGAIAAPAPGRQLEAGFRAAAFATVDMDPNVVPVAEAGPDQTVPFGTTVALSGLASGDPDSSPSPLTYDWTFWQKPWNSAAALTSPTSALTSFIPDKAGSYVLVLRVSDGVATSIPDPVVVTVANTPPIASAGPDQIVQLSSPAPLITLDGRGSSDPEGVPLTYIWRIFRKPAASAVALTGASSAQPTFVPDVPGYYRFELVVKDQILVSEPAYITVSVGSASGNLPPIAAVGPDQGLVGVNSTGLDGSGSSDPDWDQTTHPDPDVTGVYRKGLGYDWSVVSRPGKCSNNGAVCSTAADCTAPATCNLSTATIACTTPQSPAWDCPNPVLAFNGYNGNYTIGLRVTDPDQGVSDQVTMQVAVAGLVNQPPVAVANPPFTKVNMELNPANRHAYPNGSGSYDPVDPNEVLTYQWTLVEKPAGSTAALVNAGTVQAQLTIDVPGQYRAHLKVCDSGNNCSCAPGETRPSDPTCNAYSYATINTLAAARRVAMPSNWPSVGSPGGSGGHMLLQMGHDGVYDKPVVISSGFSGIEAAAAAVLGEGVDGGWSRVMQNRLREAGYDVWYLSYDPVCSGGAVPNLAAPLAIGDAETCAGNNCICPYPQVPVDTSMDLNAVVAAYAIRQAKDYGECAGKSPDDATSPCFVRLIGPSMGGVILRYALAWAEDPSETTVAGATVRAKPDGVNVWDLGARVYVSADSPHQGANIPVSLQGLVKQFEANNGFDLRMPLKAYSGVATFGIWLFINNEGFRRRVLEDPEFAPKMEKLMADVTTGLTAVGLAAGIWSTWSFLGNMSWTSEAAQAWFANPFGELGLGWIGIAVGFLQGFATGMIAGWEWGVVGGVLMALWAYVKLMLWAIPIVGAIVTILDYFFNIGSFIFNVKVKPRQEVLPDTTMMVTPFPVTPLFDSPAARQLLYQRVTSQSGCAALPQLLQGNSVANTRPGGYGKTRGNGGGDVCIGSLAVNTSSTDHDQFYARLNALNSEGGHPGYPTLTRNLGVTLGARNQTAVNTDLAMEIYLPYVFTNQQYPLGPRDHQPGSIIGDALQGQMFEWKFGMRVWLEITVKVFGIKVKKKNKLLFHDYARWYDIEYRWPFIPTESAADFRRSPTCSASLPCCQMMPPGSTVDLADDGTGSCCSCQSGLDVVYTSPVNIHHMPYMQVNPCMPDQSWDPQWLKDARAECMAPLQDDNLPGQDRLCGANKPVYRHVTPSGYLCGILPDVEARVTTGLLEAVFSQFDTRPSCSNTSASFVCLDGSPSCPADQGFWLWRGGIDRDADGCPGRYGCSTYCESDAEDADPTCVSCTTGSTGGGPVGNDPPVISAISGPQSFQLPVCKAGPDATYACIAEFRGGSTTQPLMVSVTASDPDGDPLRYQWEFLPEGSQELADVTIGAVSPTAGVIVTAHNRPPQGSYRLRVTVTDNKGGAATAETSVVVPGDATPAVTVSGPGELPEICEYEYDADNGDAWRCYAELELLGSATDPDGPDSTSIILFRWEDVTDPTGASPYGAVRLIDDPYVGNAALMIYRSEASAATISGTCSNNAALQCQRDADCGSAATCTGAYPLRFRLTAVDLRGQVAQKEVQVAICPAAGCSP